MARSATRSFINDTPLLGVVLVLLAIYMIAQPVPGSGDHRMLPRAANAKELPEASAEIRLGIDRAGWYYLDARGPDGEYTGMRFVPRDELEGRLQHLYDGRPHDRILILRADEGLDYEHVQRAIDIARRAGVRVIGSIVEQKRVDETRRGL